MLAKTVRNGRRSPGIARGLKAGVAAADFEKSAWGVSYGMVTTGNVYSNGVTRYFRLLCYLFSLSRIISRALLDRPTKHAPDVGP